MDRVKQHYVPQFLLRNFTTQDYLFVYDKYTDKTYTAAIRKIAAENGFYDFEIGGDKHSLESSLGTLEAQTAAIIKTLLTDECPSRLSPTAKHWVAIFAAVQLLRTRRRQNHNLAQNQALRDAIIKVGGDPAKATINGEKFASLTPEENRLYCLTTLGELAAQLSEHFDNKLWVLHKTRIDVPFLIGDSPVVLNNMLNQHSFKSTIGLAVPGIEIYLPISSTLTVGFFCPTIKTFLRSKLFPDEDLLRALEGTHVVTLSRENTKFLNSLQIAYAERFVYAGADDFDLVREMIAANPSFRTGLKDS